MDKRYRTHYCGKLSEEEIGKEVRVAGLLTAAAFADEVVAVALFRANENVLNAIKEEFPEEFKGSDFRRAQSIIKKLNEERNE